jgi:adenine-specific DNA-methyltransferase
MDKYLGNKRSLAESLYGFINTRCADASSICDIFSGTTNVGRYFRKRGFDVLSNDANRFSFILGASYLSLANYPTFSRLRLPPQTSKSTTKSDLGKQFFAAVKKDRGQMFPQEDAEKIWENLDPLTTVLAYLNNLKTRRKSGYIVDRFTTFGKNSSFTSLRGTSGKRNYFSLANAQRLDFILETVRGWWKDGYLNEAELYLLMTSILEEIVIVANVNGTFHDFNRDRLWPNSLQELTLRVPLVHVTDSHGRVYCQDANQLAPGLPQHDVLYLDPPYNFRQYTAYYHFLNFIAAYPVLDDVKVYLNQLEFVRGQNMGDDFTSDFCFRDRFLGALSGLVKQSQCRYVVMSYYSGRNHWNHWSQKTGGEDKGLKVLSSFFEENDMFKNSETVEVLQLRQNYQSRVGEQKKMVNEHLFFAEKKVREVSVEVNKSALGSSHPNTLLGLGQFSSFACTDIANQCGC